MDFNARMSQQFRSQNAGNGGRVKQQQNDSDAFMRLVSCYLNQNSRPYRLADTFNQARSRDRRMH